MTYSAEAYVSLVARVGTRACAIPLGHVLETMRPLPIEAIDGTAAFVAGLALIRGMPTPVIDLAALLEKRDHGVTFGRFVTLRIDQRVIALAVQTILGLRALDVRQLHALPTLFGACRSDYIEAIGTLDQQLLIVLRATRLLPDEVWGNPALVAEASR